MTYNGFTDTFTVQVTQSIPIIQVVVNGNFADGGNAPTGWGKGYGFTFDNSDTDYIVVSGRNFAYQMPQNAFIVGHKYYFKARARYINSVTDGYLYCPWESKMPHKLNSDGSWTNVVFYATAINTAQTDKYGLLRIYIGTNGCEIAIDKNFGINIFDVTEMYGSGNEPTQAEFEAEYNLPSTYYPYNE